MKQRPYGSGTALTISSGRLWAVAVLALFSCFWVSSLGAQTTSRFLLQWGSEGAGPGQFDFPIGLAINRADEVLVADHYNDRVQKFDSNGRLLACMKVMPRPGAIAVDDDGSFYVSHFPVSRKSEGKTPDRVTVYSADGTYLREWGTTGKDDGQFNFPGGIAISRDGKVYVADQTNRRVQVFDRLGKFLTKWGEMGKEPGKFGGSTGAKSRVGGPQFLALDKDGNVYTTEGSECRIQKFTAEGKYLAHWGSAEDVIGGFGGDFGPIKSSLKGPIGLCFDREGRLWLSAVSGRVQQFTPEGKFLQAIGGGQGSAPGQFLAPHALAVNSKGELFVVDAYNHRVQKFAVAQ